MKHYVSCFTTIDPPTRYRSMSCEVHTEIGTGYKAVEIGLRMQVPKAVLRRAKKVNPRAINQIFRKAIDLCMDNVVVPADDYQYYLEAIYASITHELEGLNPNDRRQSFTTDRKVLVNPCFLSWEEIIFANDVI